MSDLRPLVIFAVMYWYYAQLEMIGRDGQAAPEMSVFAATKRIMVQQKEWLAAR